MYRSNQDPGKNDLNIRIHTNRPSPDRKNISGYLILLAILTIAFYLLPWFHPERWIGIGYQVWFDILQHSGYFFIVSFVLFALFSTLNKPWLVSISLFLVSTILEFMQNLVPDRTFSLLDIFSNVCGISVALIIYKSKGLSGKMSPTS